MKIILEVPDDFNGMGITMLYGFTMGGEGGRMYNTGITRDDINGEEPIKLPKGD